MMSSPRTISSSSCWSAPAPGRQAALIVALVAGGELPAGFDNARVSAARRALLRKRAGEVATVWPLLAASFGADWPERFVTWAQARPPMGSLRDGWDFARALAGAGELSELAITELIEREQSRRRLRSYLRALTTSSARRAFVGRVNTQITPASSQAADTMG
jgi:hypothetical protein